MVWTNRTLRPLWHPLRDFGSFQHEVEQLFQDLQSLPSRVLRPALNVYTREDEVLVRAEVPGYAQEDLDIALEGRTLRLSGKRNAPDGEGNGGTSSFVRNLQLPFRVVAEEITARLSNGILELRLPRAAEDRPKRIAIESAQ